MYQMMSWQDADNLHFHPILLILIREAFLVRMGVNPFLRANHCGGTLVEFTQ